MREMILSNGVAMPLIGLGLYRINNGEMSRCVREAVECGYQLFDTAQWYGNEEGLGEGISSCGVPRDRIFITTKLQSCHRVAQSINESLSRLRTDYIDLLLIHWPMGEDLTIWRTMERFYGEGKIRAIGLSNFYGEDLEGILRGAEVVPHVIQQELHPFRQQANLLKYYRKLGIVPQAWSPLACGKNGLFENPVLLRIGKTYSKTPAQVALRFLVQCGICPLPKSTHRARMAENMNIFDFELSEEDRADIRKLDTNRGLFGWYD